MSSTKEFKAEIEAKRLKREEGVRRMWRDIKKLRGEIKESARKLGETTKADKAHKKQKKKPEGG